MTTRGRRSRGALRIARRAARPYRHRGRRFSRLGRYRRAEDDARVRRRATWSRCGGEFTPRGPATHLTPNPHAMTLNHPQPADRVGIRQIATTPAVAPS